MSNDTLTRIEADMHYFRGLNNRNPDRLYLGRLEHADMTALANQFCIVKTLHVQDRIIWRGMPVYLVDEESFVGFGIDNPSPCS